MILKIELFSEDDFKPVSSEDDDDDDSASEIDENEISDIEPESEPESPVKEVSKKNNDLFEISAENPVR